MTPKPSPLPITCSISDPAPANRAASCFSAARAQNLLQSAESLTARYLNGELRIPVPSLRRKPSRRFLRIFGARAHNLHNIDVMFPLGTMVAVTGVSGSGKSTLIYDVLYKALEAKRAGGNFKELCDRIEGDTLIEQVVLVDQSPIGRTPRSNPATYLKAFDAIRELFAATPDAKRRGFGAGHFSFNIPGGRCEACQGDGTVTVEMQFLADVELVCEECRGTRFKSAVLEVRYRDKNIHEVLGLTVREALHFFAGVPRVTSKLKILDEVGLGYLAPGAIRHHAFRRRSAAAEARRAPDSHRQPGVSFTSSTNPPPACISTISRSCSPPFASSSRAAPRSSSSSTIWT